MKKNTNIKKNFPKKNNKRKEEDEESSQMDDLELEGKFIFIYNKIFL